MRVKNIGIIIGGVAPSDHSKDIAAALKDHYTIRHYNVHKGDDIQALIRDRQAGELDIVFNNAGGKKGGDGTVEGLLSLLDIPFVGSDTLATAVAFDKQTTKSVVAAAGVPVVRGMAVSALEFLEDPDEILDGIKRKIGYPMVVKASQGSDSLGISLVKTERELVPALRTAFQHDDQIIIEDFVRRKAEVVCMVIGNSIHAHALDPVERVFEAEMLYPHVKRTYRHPDLPEATLDRIKKYALKSHQALTCADYSRSDFIVGKRGGIYFLELNAHAGLGNTGPTAYSTKHTKGWDYQQMIEEILAIAVKRYS